MSRVRIHCFSVSLDGYGAGPEQSLQNPLGRGGESLHEWLFPTQTFRGMYGSGEAGETGPDDDFVRRGTEGLGAWILGRNMFGPERGAWSNDDWRGWWGESPPYHVPVFVLTHHARASIEMEEGTTFHFVTDGIEAALKRAKVAARTRDVRVGGGVATIREYLRAGEIDEMHLAFAPILLGTGENLLEGLDLPLLGYRVSEHVPTARANHIVFRRESS